MKTQNSYNIIDVSDIHMIKVITEVGSINRAADVLHMSQPTLSKKVHRLEQKLQIELFNRQTDGMVPTQASRFLLNRGEGLASQLSGIERQLELMANMVGGQIRIGVGPIVEQLILPEVLSEFVENNYQFKLSIVTKASGVLLEQLKAGKIDLAIGPFHTSEVPEEFVSVLERSENLIMIARAGHPISQSSTISLEDLKQYRFVCPSLPRNMGSAIRNLKASADISPAILCENYTLAKTIVASSDYVTIGPESLFRTELALGTMVKVDLPSEVTWHCNCLAKPETLLMPAVKEVVKLFSGFMTSAADNTDCAIAGT